MEKAGIEVRGVGKAWQVIGGCSEGGCVCVGDIISCSATFLCPFSLVLITNKLLEEVTITMFLITKIDLERFGRVWAGCWHVGLTGLAGMDQMG